MLCPQLPPGIYPAKLEHMEPVRLLWHLATSQNKSLSPTSISLEGSGVPLGHTVLSRREVEEALPQVCAVPKHIPMYPSRADTKMALSATDLASLVAGTSPRVLLLHHTQEGLARTCHLCMFARNTVAVVLFSHKECKDICHRHGKHTTCAAKSTKSHLPSGKSRSRIQINPSLLRL